MMSAERQFTESESAVRQLTASHETYIASLEAKIQELSDTVGGVERLRQQDQLTIQKLRERLVQVIRDTVEHILLYTTKRFFG